MRQSLPPPPRYSVLLLLGVLLSVALIVTVLPRAVAQQDKARQLTQEGTEKQNSNKRIALVIGNGAYTNAPRLKNPANDATDIADALSGLGFNVDHGTDLNQKQMKFMIREFGKRLKGGAQGLFYFSGHGVQLRGHNYLIPVDAQIESETDVEDQGVDVNLVLGLMDEANNGLNVVILDACRTNPFARSFRSASSGLAQVDAPTGTLIAYATAPGRVARDGEGRNGTYTAELLKEMRVPGLPVEEMFKRVRANVRQETRGEQVPWEASSLVGDFYFNRAATTSRPMEVATSESSNTLPRVEKVSGDKMMIPVGEWRSFAVRVIDMQGHPTIGAKVAWQMPQNSSYTYVGETDQDGISTATNMYTSRIAGTFIQTATIVTRNKPSGFTDASKLITISSPVTFTFRQQ